MQQEQPGRREIRMSEPTLENSELEKLLRIKRLVIENGVVRIYDNDNNLNIPAEERENATIN